MKHLPVLFVALLMFPAARAQQIVVAAEAFSVLPVVSVGENGVVEVVEKGKRRPASKRANFTLKPAATYHEAFLDISEYRMKDAGEEGQVLITGLARPDRSLSRSYAAVEVKGRDGKVDEVRLFALSPMDPKHPASFSFQVPGKAGKKSKTRPSVRFFSSMMEIIHSEMSSSEIATAQEKRDAFTLSKTPNREVSAVHREAPEYPDSMLALGVVGTAKVRCRVDAEGKVVETTVTDASAEAFGEAAADAVKKWRFAPAIKDGQFVESTVVVPLNFSPPAGAN